MCLPQLRLLLIKEDSRITRSPSTELTSDKKQSEGTEEEEGEIDIDQIFTVKDAEKEKETQTQKKIEGDRERVSVTMALFRNIVDEVRERQRVCVKERVCRENDQNTERRQACESVER